MADISDSGRISASPIAAPWLPALLFCALLVMGWETLARASASPLVPTAGEIGDEIRRLLLSGDTYRQVGVTLARIALGFAAAAVVALVAGIVAARSILFRRFCEPALILGLTVPGLVWSLLCVIWFGVGLLAPTVVIVLVELFGLSNGVGYQLNAEFSSQNVAGVLAWTVIFWAVMVAIEYGLLQALERHFVAWRRVAEA